MQISSSLSFQRRSWSTSASVLVLVTAGWGGAGCSLKKMTVDQTAGILLDATRAFNREPDIELAQAALPATLKTMEGFLEASPEQPDLLRLLAEGYMNYAFGFVEDEAERAQEGSPERAEALRKRAFSFYLRAREFGLRLLSLDHEALANKLRANQAPSAEDLQQLESRDVPALYWIAGPWGGAINVAKSDPAMLMQLGTVRALLERCVALDEGYYHAGAHLALGAIEAGLPKALGGQPDRARLQFERAVALTGGTHLMTRVLYARLWGQQAGDRAFFEKALTEVLSSDPDADPTVGLANRLAQARARRYLQSVDDLFI